MGATGPEFTADLNELRIVGAIDLPMLGCVYARVNNAIADTLMVTKRAVERHINGIFQKLDLGEASDVNRRVKAALLYLTGEGG